MNAPLSLKKALISNRLEDFIKEQEAEGIGVADESELMEAIEVTIKPPQSEDQTVPIRLSPIPTTSRVLPIPRVKLGLGRAAISPAMSSAS